MAEHGNLNGLYRLAVPFDEGRIFQSREYNTAVRQEMDLYELLVKTFGLRIEPLLCAYTDALGDKTVLENLHYLEQGYLLGRGAEPG